MINCLAERQAGGVGVAAGTLRAGSWEPSQWGIDTDAQIQSLEMGQL